MDYLFAFIQVLVLTSFTITDSPKTTCYKLVQPAGLWGILGNQRVIVIDVRELKKYEKERIENAYLASGTEVLEGLCKNFNPNDTIVVYCEKGDRSKEAAQLLCSKLNYKNIFHLEGGIGAWKRARFPLDTSGITY